MNAATGTMLMTIALCAVTAGAQGHGQNFFFVEETSRLPPDTTLPGTSTTDVDLDVIVLNRGQDVVLINRRELRNQWRRAGLHPV